MSADNGIYVLATKGPEYRVTHAQGIENIYYDVSSGEQWENFIPEMTFEYFGECEVFTTEDAALRYAHRLAQEETVLEYGVCSLSHPDQEFQTFTEEQIEFYEAEVDAIVQRQREEREAKMVADREAATVKLSLGDVVIPSSIYCEYKDLRGNKVHGQLHGLMEIVIGPEGATFLPADWNKDA